MSASNYVHLEDCEILKVTDRAIILEHKGEQNWIPVNQLADGEDHSFEAGDAYVTVSVSEWIAKQKGLDS